MGERESHTKFQDFQCVLSWGTRAIHAHHGDLQSSHLGSRQGQRQAVEGVHGDRAEVAVRTDQRRLVHALRPEQLDVWKGNERKEGRDPKGGLAGWTRHAMKAMKDWKGAWNLHLPLQ